MFPAESSFVGETSVLFEKVSGTVAYVPLEETVPEYVPVQNSNLGSDNTAVHVGQWCRVPVEGTKTSHGTAPPAYNDGWSLIPPRLPHQELEINAGAHIVPYAGSTDSPNTPINFYNHISPDAGTTISSFGPMSIGLTDGILSVPTVCFPGSRNTYNFTDMRIEHGGDYTTGPTGQFHADASMTVSDNNETRIGIVTHSDFHAFTKFRVVFEYNPNGLNGNKGFNDTTNDGNINFTFSRVYEPRLELLPEHTDKMAVLGSHQKVKDMVLSYDVRNMDWPESFLKAPSSADGYPLLPRQKQRLAAIMGATANMFGQSAYTMPSQWNIDPVPYRLLLIDPNQITYTAHTSLCTSITEEHEGTVSLGEHSDNHSIFMKLVIPNAYNVQGPQPRMFQLQPPVYIDKLRVRVMDQDLTPYPFHGREFSLSLTFDGGKNLVGRRNP
jgi:hypothetical protein